MEKSRSPGEFVFEAVQRYPAGSVLYNEHMKLTDKAHMAPFAGYSMPLWYSSISAEHRAVRESAGMFDCTHMGVLELSGRHIEEALNLLTTNDVTKVATGKAQYGFLLDAAGNILDDVIIYRRREDCFMTVANAANETKLKAYFEALTKDKTVVDINDPDRKLEYKPIVRDMRATEGSGDCRVNIAVQGPKTIKVFEAVSKDAELVKRLSDLKPFAFFESKIRDIDCIIARTGYTGSKVGFEVFVHPDRAVEFWRTMLIDGIAAGLAPCGLGARDSLRIEAGFPLYGHELNGEFDVSPFEAGYGWAVKLEKDFFVGKEPMKQRAQTYDMTVIRMELPGDKGVRPVRPKDAVLSAAGDCLGWVLSAAHTGQKQYALGYVEKDSLNEGGAVGVYYLARSRSQVSKGKKRQVEKGEQLQADVIGNVVSRFAKF